MEILGKIFNRSIMRYLELKLDARDMGTTEAEKLIQFLEWEFAPGVTLELLDGFIVINETDSEFIPELTQMELFRLGIKWARENN
jgi:hypothetical protein